MSADIEIIDESTFVPGWIDDPEAVQAIAALQPIGAFEDSPAAQDETPLPAYVWHGVSANKVVGHYLPTRNQGNAGTCVSFGHTRAAEYTVLNSIASGAAIAFKELATEPTYGGSRVEVGGGRLGGGDGSVGAWAAEFTKRWGVAPRGNYPEFGFDLSTYSIPISRSWGRSGVPDKFEPRLRMFPIRGITQIKTTLGLRRALANGCGVAECSGRLLSGQRDSLGRIKTVRGGGHCMTVSGYILLDNGEDWYQIENSWGDLAHKGPNHPRFPTQAGGLISGPDMQLMLDAGDTWALSDVVGFPAKDNLDWRI